MQEFILRVKPKGKQEYYIGRRYGEFANLVKSLRTELPGKVLPSLPGKIKSSTTSNFLGVGGEDDDGSSVSSMSTQGAPADEGGSVRNLVAGARRSRSANPSPSASSEVLARPVTLYREEQRVSLRAFLRTLLHNHHVAETQAIRHFLTAKPHLRPNEEELDDIERRGVMDRKRIDEQKKFYEIARQRAKEVDVYMERFRRDIIEDSPSSNRPRSCMRLTDPRWPDQAFPRDPREGEARRSERPIQEVCRVAADRVRTRSRPPRRSPLTSCA